MGSPESKLTPREGEIMEITGAIKVSPRIKPPVERMIFRSCSQITGIRDLDGEDASLVYFDATIRGGIRYKIQGWLKSIGLNAEQFDEE